MSSSYTRGTRIAMDITDNRHLNADYISGLIKKIKSECGCDVPLSTHSIFSKSNDWDSVLEADSFFKNVYVIDNIHDFIKEINKDRTMKGIDVAKYILSKISSTHLKLENLVYMCFADYLCKTQQELFEDTIYAFTYGPVVKSVYCAYKAYGGEKLDSIEIKKQAEFESPQRSRILFAKNGVLKLSCIDSSINKYKKLTASELVDLTHSPGSPWRKAYNGDMYCEISINDILKYHCNESIT